MIEKEKDYVLMARSRYESHSFLILFSLKKDGTYQN